MVEAADQRNGDGLENEDDRAVLAADRLIKELQQTADRLRCRVLDLAVVLPAYDESRRHLMVAQSLDDRDLDLLTGSTRFKGMTPYDLVTLAVVMRGRLP